MGSLLGSGCEVGDVFSYSLFYVVDEVGVVDLVYYWGFFEIMEFCDVVGEFDIVIAIGQER